MIAIQYNEIFKLDLTNEATCSQHNKLTDMRKRIQRNKNNIIKTKSSAMASQGKLKKKNWHHIADVRPGRETSRTNQRNTSAFCIIQKRQNRIECCTHQSEIYYITAPGSWVVGETFSFCFHFFFFVPIDWFEIEWCNGEWVFCTGIAKTYERILTEIYYRNTYIWSNLRRKTLKFHKVFQVLYITIII